MGLPSLFLYTVGDQKSVRWEDLETIKATLFGYVIYYIILPSPYAYVHFIPFLTVNEPARSLVYCMLQRESCKQIRRAGRADTVCKLQ